MVKCIKKNYFCISVLLVNFKKRNNSFLIFIYDCCDDETLKQNI